MRQSTNTNKNKSKSKELNQMATQTEVKDATETKPEAKTEFETVMADTTVVSDKVFIRLMGAVDTQQKTVGGKWVKLIEHCRDDHKLLGHLQKEFKDLSQSERDELKAGKLVVLKSLGEMGKTESSAQSIRSYIIKMCKSENAPILDQLRAGDITVRASRAAGTKSQANPAAARSNEARYKDGLETAVRYAVSLGYDIAKLSFDAAQIWPQYEKKDDSLTEAEKAKQKEEAKQAIEETRKMLASK